MIGRADIDDRVRAWGLREDVVEKDYVAGWERWGIGGDPFLGRTWIFKGGTCLKKGYIETYRFSEDLDFTVLEEGPVEPEAVLEAVGRVLDRATLARARLFPVSCSIAKRSHRWWNGTERSIDFRTGTTIPGPVGGYGISVFGGAEVIPWQPRIN